MDVNVPEDYTILKAAKKVNIKDPYFMLPQGRV